MPDPRAQLTNTVQVVWGHQRRVAQRTTLGWRVFIGVMAVCIVNGTVLAIVATVVGPSQFAVHLPMAQDLSSEATAQHAQAAYHEALAISLAAGLVVALVGAFIAAWAISRRITVPLNRFSKVAMQVSNGDYSARVHSSKLGPEFDQVEEAFNEMSARLEAIEETRAQLIADVTHEMRAPLMTLTAYLDAVEDGVRPADSSSWSVMADQIERLSRLATDMASASSAQEAIAQMELGEHDLVTLATRTVVAWREGGGAARSLKVTLTTPKTPVLIRCAPTRLAQVLVNLLDNAVRHAHGMHHLHVEVRGDGEEAELSVTDDGSGIAAADRGHVFDRFYRAERSRTSPGSGLGLAIARAIVTAHRGRIRLERGIEGGARFVVTLPKS